MGFSWHEARQELANLSGAKLSAAFIAIAAFMAGFYFGGYWKTAENNLLQKKLEISEAHQLEISTAFLKKLDAAIINGGTKDQDAGTVLDVCRQLVPELDEFSSATFFKAADELERFGCGTPNHDDCKIPAILELLGGYHHTRNKIRTALGESLNN